MVIWFPPMTLPVPPDCIEDLEKISKMARKGILPSPLRMVSKIRYPLPV